MNLLFKKQTMKKFTLSLALLFICFLTQAQSFEGTLSIKTTYKENAKDTTPSNNNFKLLVKGDKAAIDQSGTKIILQSKTNEMFMIMNGGTQPTVWKINLTTVNQLGGLLALMKSITGQDVMNINAKTQLTATTSTTTIGNYKCNKYTTADANHTGSVFISNNFPFDMNGIWSALNIMPALKNAGIEKGMILKAVSKSTKTGESNTMTITPKQATIADTNFEIPAKAQMIDVTPLLAQMMQNKSPEEVQKMLEQMMPKKK